MICVVRKLTTWNWEILLFDSSWKAKSNEIKILFYHANHLCLLWRRSELKTIWFVWYMFILRKQSFCTFLDMFCVLLWYTGLYFPMVFLEIFSKTTVTLLYDIISVPPSQYCTFLNYHVVLLSIIMLYFHLSLYCTFLRHNIVLPSVIIFFFFMTHFYAKLWGAVYFPKLSIHTFSSYCCVLPVIAMLYFRLWKLFLFIFTRDRVYSTRPDNHTSCSHSCVIPFPLR
jgi:hypothetical protein